MPLDLKVRKAKVLLKTVFYISLSFRLVLLLVYTLYTAALN